MTALRHATLAEQAYEELKSQIMSGRRPAGQRLLAEELASQLAISQTPIKEALVELERDGLVEGTSRRASTVRRFTPDDIVQILDARILIETHAATAGLRARRADAAFMAALEQNFAAHVAHAEGHNLAEALRLDREFHEALVGLGANPVMSDWHRMLLLQTQTIRSYSLARYDAVRLRAEHGAIIAALHAGKPAALLAALRDHLLASRDEMLGRPANDLPPRPG